jgi:hypothetical protein
VIDVLHGDPDPTRRRACSCPWLSAGAQPRGGVLCLQGVADRRRREPAPAPPPALGARLLCELHRPRSAALLRPADGDAGSADRRRVQFHRPRGASYVVGSGTESWTTATASSSAAAMACTSATPRRGGGRACHRAATTIGAAEPSLCSTPPCHRTTMCSWRHRRRRRQRGGRGMLYHRRP